MIISPKLIKFLNVTFRIWYCCCKYLRDQTSESKVMPRKLFGPLFWTSLAHIYLPQKVVKCQGSLLAVEKSLFRKDAQSNWILRWVPRSIDFETPSCANFWPIFLAQMAKDVNEWFKGFPCVSKTMVTVVFPLKLFHSDVIMRMPILKPTPTWSADLITPVYQLSSKSHVNEKSGFSNFWHHPRRCKSSNTYIAW